MFWIYISIIILLLSNTFDMCRSEKQNTGHNWSRNESVWWRVRETLRTNTYLYTTRRVASNPSAQVQRHTIQRYRQSSQAAGTTFHSGFKRFAVAAQAEEAVKEFALPFSGGSASLVPFRFSSAWDQGAGGVGSLQFPLWGGHL